jgi:hypothetical protein
MMLLTVPAVRVTCDEYDDGWFCTRPTGHGGRHLATYSCGVRGRRVVVRVWGEDVHRDVREAGRRVSSAATLGAAMTAFARQINEAFRVQPRVRPWGLS